MVDIRSLLNTFATAEAALQTQQFLAPCVRGGRIRTQVSGLTYIFRPKPWNFEGWGIFQPQNAKTAECVQEANIAQVEDYLHAFEAFRFFLTRSLQHRTWLAFPTNGSDMKQRLGWLKPVTVRLVDAGELFEPVVARWDGCVFWFEARDRRADPQPIDRLRQAFQARVPPDRLTGSGLTPELRIAYDLATQHLDEFSSVARDERRLREVLALGGGQLQHVSDREEYWQVEWTTADGRRHASAISKNELTVLSAGICLSGRDRDFDLQSLVGVIEQQEDWYEE